MATSVEVSVEAVIENQIQEVTLDGQEIYVQPLSMSENLTKLAQKIDFSKDESDEKGKPTSEVEKEEETQQITPFQPSLWPWDSVRNKLKAAYTEMSVMVDVLTIAKEKHYMLLEPVQREAHENKLNMHLMAKKKGLGAAYLILSSGYERIRRPVNEMPGQRRPLDFHVELLKLRKSWRLKKVGGVILGDLSYRSAGSRYWQGGTFEVSKSDMEPPGPYDITSPNKVMSFLQVTVPSDLEVVSYIQVVIKHIKDKVDLASVELKLPTDISGTVPSDAHWQRKLEAAQNVIFCKEVFQQLAREAVSVKSKIPHMVVGNQIFSHLFPGIQLSIALCHHSDKDKRASHVTGDSLRSLGKQYGVYSGQASIGIKQKPEHNHVLEHSLHQLLREVHHKNLYHPLPHPITALMGMSRKRRLAGPRGYTRAQLNDLIQMETLLEQIIQQAKHIVLRQRAMKCIDDMAKSYQDPQVSAHASNISSPTESLMKLAITSQGYEICRTPVMLHVGVDNIKAICKDGIVYHMGHEDQELKDFIKAQVAQHYINTIQNVSKIMGWTTLSRNTYVPVGNMEPYGNAMTLSLASPSGNRLLSVRCGPVSGVEVSVKMCPSEPEEIPSPSFVTNPKWSNLGGPFHRVHLERMEGKNLVNKIELLLAAFAANAKLSDIPML